jgi:hypothetical protein
MEARRVKAMLRFLSAVCLLSLAACNNDASDDPVQSTKKEKAQKSAEAIVAPAEESIGTPMAERVAILGFLNKRNGQTRDLELKPGQYIRAGKVEVRLRACEKTKPWETYPDQGAFVQLVVFERPPGTTSNPRWRQIFSGWLFKNNPAANIVQHPIYDIWVKECRMSFPGEEEDAAAPASDGDSPAKAAVKKPSSTPQSAPETAGANAAGDAPDTAADAATEEPTVETN